LQDFFIHHYFFIDKAFDKKTNKSLLIMVVGVLLVGLGGNNGSTFVGSLLAHRKKVTWRDHSGKVMSPDWLGSVVMSGATEYAGTFFNRFDFTHPDDIVFGGWDISSANMYEAVKRSGVLNWQIAEQLEGELSQITPMKGVYDGNYIAQNQRSRVDNAYSEDTPLEELIDHIRADIRRFKEQHDLERVIVLWTANTERMMEVVPGCHSTEEGILQAVAMNRKDLVSPSMVYALAAINEDCPYLNGSPQNTLLPGILKLAARKKVFVGGNDFKTGQTRFKSMMMDFLSLCGIRATSIVSYNHLGNNDGLNLSQENCFRSKEISKRDVVSDVVEANPQLYPNGEGPDHCVVIKYVPSVGDSKRAIDEYVADIFMGGKQTISVYNVCEDSLLAAPIMLDLVLLTDFFTRRKDFDYPVLMELSFFFKAPLPHRDWPTINVLRHQHRILEQGLEECGETVPCPFASKFKV
jgi:myo-inositol-1-phosphate synthase